MSDRDPAEAMALMDRLLKLGIAGRDAAYLASLAPPIEQGTPEMTNYVREFEHMVTHAARASAATLVGLAGGYYPQPRLIGGDA